ncbi:MAG: hypothetical protein ACRER2_06365 [Methylococcales bacterium]
MHGEAACKVAHREVRHECGILAQAAWLGQGAPAAVTISSSPIDAIPPVSPASRSLRLSKSVPDGLVLQGTRDLPLLQHAAYGAGTAAHLVDEVFPQVPVRQWVLSFPKRPRYFLGRDVDLINRVLQIFLNSVEKTLHSGCPDAPDHGRSGAITFVCLGSALNGNIHCHCRIIEAVCSVLKMTAYGLTRRL